MDAPSDIKFSNLFLNSTLGCQMSNVSSSISRFLPTLACCYFKLLCNSVRLSVHLFACPSICSFVRPLHCASVHPSIFQLSSLHFLLHADKMEVPLVLAADEGTVFAGSVAAVLRPQLR